MSGEPIRLPSTAPDDALSLFGAEAVRRTDLPANPPSSGGISVDRIRGVAPLKFVEGVAVVQAICEASARDRGAAAGLPGLSGVSLTSTGSVLLDGPPTAEPPARQAARLLHELIAPEQTPPAARLFIGRWTNSDAQSLSEFNSELAYFARPNGRDLIAALHERSAANPALPPAALAVPAAPAIVRQPEPRKTEVQRTPGEENRLAAWLRAHRRQVIGGTAVAAAFLAAGLTVAIWPSSAAGRPPSVSEDTSATDVEQTVEKGPGAAGKNPAAATTGQSARARATETPTTSISRDDSGSTIPPTPSAALVTADATLQEAALAPGVPAAIAPAQSVRDSRVYTAADSDVEPPVLQSPEIPEWLITGFDVRKNSVELLIAETGEVLRAKMLAAPQRLPDVMLLSRVKEWTFAPATRGGVPVRYRLVLSWNVTP